MEETGTPQPQSADPKTSSTAIVAVVLSGFGLIWCPLICSIAGLIVASRADKEIRNGGGLQGGEEMVSWARWLGWIGIVYGLLICAFVAFLVEVR